MSTVQTGEPTAIGAGDRALDAGDVVGEYVIEGQLGKGGFGTVYAAVHPLIGKRAAIKILARKYSSDEAMVSRFVAEARAVNQIRHQNIIDIFAFGQLVDGRHYYVMELLEGESLEQYLRRNGPLTLAEALPILAAIAKALDAAHAKGIAHRDLKPENIFLAMDGEGDRFPKLLDFGIAKLMTPEELSSHRTATGAPIGTPYYMSPEQCRGKDVDHRTDIYSFGIVAYRLLTGEYPFEADGYLDLMMLQINAEPAPPSSRNPMLSRAIDAAIATMMRKDAIRRPSTVTQAVAAMSATRMMTPALEATSPTAATPLAPLAAPSPARRLRVTWVVLAAVLGTGGAAAYVWTRSIESNAHGGAIVEPYVPPAPVRQPALVDAGAAVASSPHVIVRLAGAPEGMEIRLAAEHVGYAPAFQLDRGGAPVVLTFLADGYVPGGATITPDHDQLIEVVMKPRPRSTTGSRKSAAARDDIIHEIPGLTP